MGLDVGEGCVDLESGRGGDERDLVSHGRICSHLPLRHEGVMIRHMLEVNFFFLHLILYTV